VFSIHWANAQQDQIEISPLINTALQNLSENDSLNLQFSFPTIAFIGEYGVETDGNLVYVTQWLDDSIATYDQSGNVLEEFVIPGVGRTRDMAYDGQYYYGSPNEFYFYVLDLDNKTLINTFQTSFKIRGMAYDPVEDVLWASEHWNPYFYKLDKQGNILDQWIPSGITMDAISGLGFDNFSPGGPFLWGFSQDSTGAMIVKYDIASQTQTGNMIDVSNLVAEPAYAGGLFIHQMDQRDVPTIGGMIQNQLVFSLELDYANMLVGIPDDGIIELMEVYPNPATDVITIRYQMPDARGQMIGLFAVDGTKVWGTLIDGNDTEVEIDVSNIPAGIYFIRLQSGNNFISKKIVLAR
jgi:hypothetical protein